MLLDDGRELDAWIVGSDTRTDLAVVKITADGLVPASFGDSDILQVGERAVAIGNAAGQLSGTVTQGIISGLNREISMQAGNSVVTMNLIQTSAAINPGNSGGALVNRFGQVIGINSAKLNSSMFEGIGFAIPSADAQPVVGRLFRRPSGGPSGGRAGGHLLGRGCLDRHSAGQTAGKRGQDHRGTAARHRRPLSFHAAVRRLNAAGKDEHIWL